MDGAKAAPSRRLAARKAAAGRDPPLPGGHVAGRHRRTAGHAGGYGQKPPAACAGHAAREGDSHHRRREDMTHTDEDLKSALRRCEAPEGFTDRVLARVANEQAVESTSGRESGLNI